MHPINLFGSEDVEQAQHARQLPAFVEICCMCDVPSVPSPAPLVLNPGAEGALPSAAGDRRFDWQIS